MGIGWRNDLSVLHTKTKKGLNSAFGLTFGLVYLCRLLNSFSHAFALKDKSMIKNLIHRNVDIIEGR